MAAFLLISLQTILSGVLVDATTQVPIDNSFIFIKNSSTSTTSDISGTFQLDIGDVEYGEVVFTHLNYETKSIPFVKGEPFPNTITLIPKKLDMETILVQSKGSNLKKRKKWMKRFQKGFFGATKHSRGISFLNPEVIWFQEKGDVLQAEAMDYLSILNQAMGYKLRVYLESFESDKQENTRYVAKVFFEDVLPQMPKPKKCEKRRIEAYQESKNHFFKSLWASKVDTTQYVFGLADLEDGKLVSFEPTTLGGLDIERQEEQLIIRTDQHFAFANKGIISDYFTFVQGMSGLRSNTHANGFLKSRNGQIIIDRRGNIRNAQEVEELGYWTQQRVANLLPIEYHSRIELLPEKDTDKNLPGQEKIYVHLNKPYYSLTDEIWFKAYLVNAFNHSPYASSKVVYVELIDPQGAVEESWMLHTEKGLEGYFAFNKTHSEGDYHLRAYTDYMRNLEPAYFFTTTFRVFNHVNPTEELSYRTQLVSTSKKNDIPLNKRKELDLHFYPEGGHLVEGINSDVIFEVTDKKGMPVDIKGEVRTQDNELIANIKTMHEGVGFFKLNPTINQNYHVLINYSNTSYRFDLPKASNKRAIIKANNTYEDKFFIEVISGQGMSLANANLVGKVRGEYFCNKEELEVKNKFTFAKSDIPVGVVYFALIDENDKLLSERWIFNDYGLATNPLEIKPTYSYFQPRQKVELKISLKDRIPLTTTNLSASVTDKSVVQYNTEIDQLPSYLLLNSEVEKPILNLPHYLKKPNKQKRFLLDMLLMTRTKQRFKETSTDQSVFYAAEKGYTIRGYTTTLDSVERIASQITLNALSQNFYSQTLETDQQGNFIFSNLPFLDSLTYFFQASMLGVPTTRKEIRNSKKVAIHFHEKTSPPFYLDTISLTNKINTEVINTYLKYEEQAQEADSIYSPEWQIDLEEITVKGKRARDSRTLNLVSLVNAYHLDEIDWIPPTTSGVRLLSSVKPGNTYHSDYSTGKIVNQFFNVYGELVRTPIVVYIDGFEEVNHLRFTSLTADLIETIYVNGIVVSVITRKNGPRTLKTKFKNGTLHAAHPGYASAPAFSTPNYSTKLPIHQKPDLRTAIYWEPNLSFNDKGEAYLSFYAADTPTTYQVRVEGMTASGMPISTVYEVEVK